MREQLSRVRFLEYIKIKLLTHNKAKSKTKYFNFAEVAPGKSVALLWMEGTGKSSKPVKPLHSPCQGKIKNLIF